MNDSGPTNGQKHSTRTLANQYKTSLDGPKNSFDH